MESQPLSTMERAMLLDHHAAVRAIITAHQDTLGLPVGTAEDAAQHPAEANNPNAPNSPVYRAAQEAAQALGFLPLDAQCIATAWHNSSLRQGRFDPTLWPDAPVDFGLPPWPRPQAFARCPKNLGLYAVLPTASWVARMAQAGVPTLQLRFKSDDPHAIAHEVQAAVAATQGTASLLFINDHWQAALQAGAYGVHLGQEDLDRLSPADVQAMRQAGLRLGLSTHGYAEMLRADALSPSYIALGAVFPTTLKRMATAPQGTGRLKAYARLLQHHALVAIGGIDLPRLPDVLRSGVGSVAVVRALVEAADPETQARELQRQMQHVLAQ